MSCCFTLSKWTVAGSLSGVQTGEGDAKENVLLLEANYAV